MKWNKKYIIEVLTVQLVLLPILITAGIFILFVTGGELLNKGLGGRAESNLAQLAILALISFGSLLIGTAVGFVFSKVNKNKPSTVKGKYIPLIIPTIYSLVLALLVTIFSKDNPNTGWWLVYAIKSPMFFILDIALIFMGMNFFIIPAEIMGYVGVAGGYLLQEAKANSTVKDRNSRSLKTAFAGILIGTVFFSLFVSRRIISNGYIEMMYGKSTIGKDLTEYDLFKIAPFKENNGLAKLSKKASLQFAKFEDMPRLDGATAAYPVYSAFTEAVYTGFEEYMRENKDSREKDMYMAFVEADSYPLNIVKCSKTNRAYDRLINGETDIIFTAEPSKDQLKAIKDKGDEFELTPIASEAFVFFTNVKNPVENLSTKEIQDIYSGKITNWKKVGGENRKILPFQRPENSGSQTIMQNKVMRDIEMMKPDTETYAGGMGDIIKEVASYKNAKNSIGYSFMYYSSSMIKNNQIKYIAVDGVKPTVETVINKTYPFTVPVYAVTLKSNKNENVAKMINWILSEEGQELIEKTGYVPMGNR